MSTVYFICRSQYEAPLGHRIVKFQAQSVLHWFQLHWPSPLLTQDQNAFADHLSSLLRGHVYGMWSLCESIAQFGPHPPRNLAELQTILTRIYSEGPIHVQEHAIQVQTDDDEIDIAWYLFDQSYLDQNLRRLTYLIREDWRLPFAFHPETGLRVEIPCQALIPAETSSSPGSGRTHAVFLSALDGQTLTDITGAYFVDGVRLPDFGPFLTTHPVPFQKRRWGTGQESVWPEELLLTRALLFDETLAPAGPFIGAARSLTSLLSTFESADAAPILTHLWNSPRAVADITYPDQATFLAGDVAACRQDLAQLRAQLEKELAEHPGYQNAELIPLIQISPHFCQIRFHWRPIPGAENPDHHKEWTTAYLFFDDLWAAANPLLAESLLHYATTWEILDRAAGEGKSAESTSAGVP